MVNNDNNPSPACEKTVEISFTVLPTAKILSSLRLKNSQVAKYYLLLSVNMNNSVEA